MDQKQCCNSPEQPQISPRFAELRESARSRAEIKVIHISQFSPTNMLPYGQTLIDFLLTTYYTTAILYGATLKAPLSAVSLYSWENDIRKAVYLQRIKNVIIIETTKVQCLESRI